MCYGHVIDLASGHVIKGFTSTGDDEDWSGPALPNTPGNQTYDDAVACDPVALGCTVVQVIRASGTRCDAFDEVITDGNAKGWFKLVGLL